MASGVSKRGMVAVVRRDGWSDEVAVEEPLEIRHGGRALSITMRTPGHDEELAAGVLFAEGLIDGPADIGPTDDLEVNTVEVRSPLAREPAPQRNEPHGSAGQRDEQQAGGAQGGGTLAAITKGSGAWPGSCWRPRPTACASPPSRARAACTGCTAAPRPRWDCGARPAWNQGEGERRHPEHGLLGLTALLARRVRSCAGGHGGTRSARASGVATRHLLRRSPQLRAALAANALWETALNALRAFVLLFFTVGLGRSPSFASAVFAVVAVAAFVAAPVAGTLADRFGHRRVMMVALWLYGGGMLVPLFSQATG